MADRSTKASSHSRVQVHLRQLGQLLSRHPAVQEIFGLLKVMAFNVRQTAVIGFMISNATIAHPTAAAPWPRGRHGHPPRGPPRRGNRRCPHGGSPRAHLHLEIGIDLVARAVEAHRAHRARRANTTSVRIGQFNAVGIRDVGTPRCVPWRGRGQWSGPRFPTMHGRLPASPVPRPDLQLVPVGAHHELGFLRKEDARRHGYQATVPYRPVSIAALRAVNAASARSSGMSRPSQSG